MKDISSFEKLRELFINFPDFLKPNINLEQYTTPLQTLRYYFDLFPRNKNNSILDLGIGTGKLAFLASMLGAKNIVGIDIDKTVLKSINKKIISNLTLIHSPIEFFPFENLKNKFDGVIMNPPFGTQRKFIDIIFLKKALSIGGWILSLHKNNIKSHQKIENLSKDFNYSVKRIESFDMILPNSQIFHQKENYSVGVSLYYLIPNS